MEQIIGFVLACIALIINILATIVSIYAVIFLIWHEWRLRDGNLLLVINTYIAVLICNVIQVYLNIHSILGDMQLYIGTDSFACQARGYVYLYISTWLFNSFNLQAYLRMLRILHLRRTQFQSLWTIMALIVITCFASFLLVIPTIFLKVIVYIPSEYQCRVDLSMWEGNLYMMFGLYSIPIAIIVIIYVRVVKFVRKSSLNNQKCRKVSTTVRDFVVLQRIVILVSILIVLGLPSAILWIYGIATGQLHSLTFRIQAIFLAPDIFILSCAVALTNPPVKRLILLCEKRQETHHITGD